MFTHILVPLDGSERAERALPAAARIAQSAAARLTLVHVLHIPGPIWAPLDPAVPGASRFEQDQADAQAYLSRVASRPYLSGLALDTKLVVGVPAASILDAAQECHTDLIVLCSHGRTGPTRWLLGSVAEQVASHAAVPVLVLRENGPLSTDPACDPERLRHALVPLDGSPFAEAALVPATSLITALAAPGRGALHLAMVVSPHDAHGRTMVVKASALESASTYLMRVADRVRGTYPQLAVSWSVTPEQDVAGTLLRVAKEGARGATSATTVGAGSPGRYDLIAIATHGRTGITSWALGGVTERVLHATSLPLLMVRPQAVAMPHAVEQSVVVSNTVTVP